MDDAARAIAENDVVIVIGETGSGKTTKLPCLLLDHGLGPICVTQPRRVAAIAAARRVAHVRGGGVGAEVGFAVRFEHKCTDVTNLKFVTDGVLLREAAQVPELPQYQTVMLDEVQSHCTHHVARARERWSLAPKSSRPAVPATTLRTCTRALEFSTEIIAPSDTRRNPSHAGPRTLHQHGRVVRAHEENHRAPPLRGC